MNNTSFVLSGDSMDSSFNTAIEELYKNEYNLSEEIVRNKIFIDVGAGYGEVGIMASLYKASKVYMYEPNPYLFRYLENNVSPFKNIFIYNVGVYSQKAKSTLYFRNTGSGSGSISEVQYDPASITGQDRFKVEIDLIGIEQILNLCRKSEVIIKIDAEGAEYKIIDTIKNFKYNHFITDLRIEYHAGVQSIISDLASIGFSCKTFHKMEQMGLIEATRINIK